METIKTAQDYFNSGKVYYEEGKFEEAIKEFEAAVALNEKFADAYYYWGLSLTKGKLSLTKKTTRKKRFRFDYKAAAENFKKAYEYDGTNENALFEWGYCLYYDRNYKESIEIFKNYIDKKYSKESEALKYIGSCFEALNDLEQALDYYKKMYVSAPDNDEAYTRIAYVLGNIEPFELAKKKYAELNVANDKAVIILTEWGDTLKINSKYSEALEIYRKALELDNDNTKVNNETGDCLIMLNKPEEAIEHLEKVIKLDADYEQAYENIGSALAGIEPLSKAQEKYADLTIAKDKAGLVFSKWGDKLKELKKYTDAIIVYEESLKLDPKFEKANYNIGDCLIKLNRQKEAVEYFKKAWDDDQDDEQALNSLGFFLYQTKEYKQAIEKYETYLEKKFYDVTNVLNVIGLCWQNLKDYDKALEYFEKILKDDPDHAYALRNKAYTIFLKGDANKSIQYYEYIIKRKPDEKDNYLDYGNVLLDLDLYNEAISIYRKALALDANFAFASHNIAYIYEKTGRFAKAIEQWKHTAGLYEKTKDQFIRNNDASYFLYYASIQSYYVKNKKYAEEIFLEGIELFPENAELLYEFAKLNKSQKDNLKLNSKKPGKKKEDSFDASNKINSCHIYLWENYRKAIRILNKDVELNNSEISYRKLGDFHLLMEDYDKAIECLDKAINIDNGNIDSFTSLGVAHLKNCNYPEAIKNFRKGLLTDPEDMNLQSNLAEAYLKLKNYSDAENIFQSLYVISHFYQEALLGLGELYKVMGDNALERKNNAESEEYFKRSRDYFHESMAANQKPEAASRALTQAEISSVNYSLGYINAKLYETQSDHPLHLLQDAVNNFSKVNDGDSNAYKANISIAKITAILNKKSWIVSEKASSVIIVFLAVLIFSAAQICFFYGRPVYSTTYSVKAADVKSFITLNKLDSLKLEIQKISLIEASSKEELQSKIIHAAPKSVKEPDVQSLVNNATHYRVRELQQIEEGSYALISFGSLIFIVAGLVLKQLSKLKVGAIELEKSTIETASTSSSLNIRS